jgi:hypothetical protein
MNFFQFEFLKFVETKRNDVGMEPGNIRGLVNHLKFFMY